MVKKGINLLLLDTRSRTRSFLEPGRIPSPIQKKFGPTGFIKEKARTLRLHKIFKKLSFEIFIRCGERAEQSVTRPTYKRQLANGLGRVRSVVVQGSIRSWRESEHITNEATEECYNRSLGSNPVQKHKSITKVLDQ